MSCYCPVAALDESEIILEGRKVYILDRWEHYLVVRMHNNSPHEFPFSQEPKTFGDSCCVFLGGKNVFQKGAENFQFTHKTLNVPFIELNNIVRLKTASCPSLTSEKIKRFDKLNASNITGDKLSFQNASLKYYFNSVNFTFSSNY